LQSSWHDPVLRTPSKVTLDWKESPGSVENLDRTASVFRSAVKVRRVRLDTEVSSVILTVSLVSPKSREGHFPNGNAQCSQTPHQISLMKTNYTEHPKCRSPPIARTYARRWAEGNSKSHTQVPKWFSSSQNEYQQPAPGCPQETLEK